MYDIILCNIAIIFITITTIITLHLFYLVNLQ